MANGGFFQSTVWAMAARRKLPCVLCLGLVGFLRVCLGDIFLAASVVVAILQDSAIAYQGLVCTGMWALGLWYISFFRSKRKGDGH